MWRDACFFENGCVHAHCQEAPIWEGHRTLWLGQWWTEVFAWLLHPWLDKKFCQACKTGFGPGMMTAIFFLLSKIRGALSLNHARPITIVSCLYHLLGKFISLVTANVWKMFFAFDVSGGLPGRGVKELAYTQKHLIEDALDDGQNLGGYPLDLVKAYTGFLRFFYWWWCKIPEDPYGTYCDVGCGSRYFPICWTSDLMFTVEPSCPLFHVSQIEAVAGEQTVARAELMALLVAVRKASLVTPFPRAEFVTDASYVLCKLVRLIELNLVDPIRHKLNHGDLIS